MHKLWRCPSIRGLVSSAERVEQVHVESDDDDHQQFLADEVPHPAHRPTPGLLSTHASLFGRPGRV